MRQLYFTVLFLGFSLSYGTVVAQYIPYHTDNEDIYVWLNDLRVAGIVEFNPAVRPLSRKQIAELLIQADSSGQLNSVQTKELAFWWREFGKEVGSGKKIKKTRVYTDSYFKEHPVKKRIDALYYSSELFQVTVNPILSINGFLKTDGTIAYNRSLGGEIFGRVGKGFGFYINVRENVEKPNWNGNPNLSPELGGVYRESTSRSTEDAIEFYELRGGITYGWKWGSIGIIKDHIQLGTTENQEIIISKRAPSFPRLHLKVSPVPWAELTYTIGWLNSNILDSAQSYPTGNGAYRDVFHQKYYAANMLTFRPWKSLHVSIGSSVVIADGNLNIGHFIPIMFYTALDQSFNSQNNSAGQNSQFFGDVSWNAFKYVQLYGSVLVDEIRLSTMFDKEKQRNAVTWKLGLRSRSFTSVNLKIYGSYTQVRPGVYSHYIPTTAFSHAGYNMGHFLGENSDQIIAGLEMRPLPKWRIILEWEQWRKGKEVEFGISAANLTGADFMPKVLARRTSYTIRSEYHLINDIRFNAGLQYIDGFTNDGFLFPQVSSGVIKSIWFFGGIQVGI